MSHAFMSMFKSGELPNPLVSALSKSIELAADDVRIIENAIEESSNRKIQYQAIRILTERVENKIDSLTPEREKRIANTLMLYPESRDESESHAVENIKSVAHKFFIQTAPLTAECRDIYFNYVRDLETKFKVASVKAFLEWPVFADTITFLDSLLHENQQHVVFAVLQLLENSEGLKVDNWFLKHDVLLSSPFDEVRGLYYSLAKSCKATSPQLAEKLERYEKSATFEEDRIQAVTANATSSVYDWAILYDRYKPF